LFGSDPALLNWMKFRADSLTNFFATVFGLVRDMSPNSLLGVGVRSAAFGPLCGYDFARLMHHLDYLLPKHYFWHRGNDGMYGTVARWVRQIAEWISNDSHKHLLPYVIAAILAISYPLGLLVNRFLQWLFIPREGTIQRTEYMEILNKNSNGLIVKELEVKYGFLLFWRLSAVAMLGLGVGFSRIWYDGNVDGAFGLLVSLIHKKSGVH
ncbi:hypothetical protein IH799_07130, partial [candidate division KSB1 bacterium]|nr:hypothetical protein [candidate division KSB1 bacterium]